MKTSPWLVVPSGSAALAVAMGIGRFAFTPILPMMQEDAGLSLSEGAWLACANYLGYLLGALAAIRGRVGERSAIRFGLVVVALTTLGMAFTESFVIWLFLRGVAGFASASVLVYASTWSLERLGKAGRSDLSGAVYAGVGSGIVFTGLACLAVSQIDAGARAAWLVLALSAIVVTVALWRILGSDPVGGSGVPDLKISHREIPEFWRLVLCYGAFGLGYIIPATFLPVMAKQIIADPLGFGWAWPAFGAAALISTLVAAQLTRYLSNRSVWILTNLIMALGVLVPLAIAGLTGIVISALCVGGTFMVITMVGLREAKRIAGARAQLLMAAMTSAFAAGQIIGPLLVGGLMQVRDGFTVALVIAALPLLFAAYTLFVSRGTMGTPSAVAPSVTPRNSS